MPPAARARGDRADDDRAARVPRRDGRARGRAGAHHGHLRAPATPPTATSSSTPPRSSSARGPSCCRARRRASCRSSAPPPTSTAAGPFLVVDIGGGSTEFIVGTDDAEGVISVDIGCVRLTEKELHHDPPQPEELSIALVDGRRLPRRRPTARCRRVADAQTFIGVAGTITTVAAVEIGLASTTATRIHHFRLTHAAAEDVFRTLATEPREARIANPGSRRPAPTSSSAAAASSSPSCGRSASTSASCPKPTSSTASCCHSSDRGHECWMETGALAPVLPELVRLGG